MPEESPPDVVVGEQFLTGSGQDDRALLQDVAAWAMRSDWSSSLDQQHADAAPVDRLDQPNTSCVTVGIRPSEGCRG